MTPRAFTVRCCLLLAGAMVARVQAGSSVTPSTAVVDTSPTFIKWSAPEYTPEMVKDKLEGTVKVRLVVDAQGHITDARVLESSNARLEEPALKSVRSWKLSPAVEYGEPVVSSSDVKIRFSLAGRKRGKLDFPPSEDLLPEPSPRTAVEEKSTPAGEYPAILTERKIQGAVMFACIVDATGRVVQPRITGATHVEFVQPALDALQRWEFVPAKQGDLAVKSAIDAKITFDSTGDSREDVLLLNGVTALDGEKPSPAPELYIVADPVFPYDLLLKGEGGSAVAEFTVYANGSVTNVKLREATQPEFGRALVSALETWGFAPALDENRRAATVTLRKRAEFKPVTPGKESTEDPTERLVAAARAKAIGSAKNLDEPLSPIYRQAPAYPAALEGDGAPSGTAEIEFVIDRGGRARLPHVVSASREEFGWAAATAVAQWVFNAPLRGGQPVDVLVRIPFEFSPPAK